MDETSEQAEAGTYKQEIVRRLKEFMTWSDEVPDTRVSTREKQYYKVTSGWWQGIFITLSRAKDLVSPRLQQEITQFLDQFGSEEFRTRLTTADDIKQANSVINRVLQELEEQ